MTENDISRIILDAAFEVHTQLGPGLLESSYQKCLSFELIERGLSVELEQPLPLIYKGHHLDCGNRLDIWVNKKVIVEIKAVAELNDIHLAQVLTYLKLTNNHLGLLLNFNVRSLKNGIRRVIL
jgi:GxxExxY protein